MKEPAREHRKGYGWPVSLTRDRQSLCKGCGAEIYFVLIRRKDGVEKIMPLSRALSKLDPVTQQLYLGGHHADCRDAGRFGGTKR